MSGKKWMYGHANKAGKGIAKELGVHQSIPPNVGQTKNRFVERNGSKFILNFTQVFQATI